MLKIEILPNSFKNRRPIYDHRNCILENIRQDIYAKIGVRVYRQL